MSQEPKLGQGFTITQNIPLDSSGRVISPTQILPHDTSLTRDTYPSYMRDSNPHSQQASGRRHTPLTDRSLGSAYNCRYYSQTEQTALIPSNKTRVYLTSCAFTCTLHVSASSQAIIRHVNTKLPQRKITIKLL